MCLFFSRSEIAVHNKIAQMQEDRIPRMLVHVYLLLAESSKTRKMNEDSPFLTVNGVLLEIRVGDASF